MPPRPNLLCLSLNSDLCETRRRVLLTRYAAVGVPSMEALQDLPATPSFNLLVLCHTLRQEQVTASIHLARQKWPGIKILSISSLNAGPSCPGADAVMGGLAGPRAMLDRIASLLAERSDHER